MSSVRWGIIGPGAIAHNFATAISEADNATLIAVAGRSTQTLSKFTNQFGVEASPSVETLLNRDDVDAIYIATPHIAHAGLAIQALRAGKHVLCEKPLGICPGEVISVIEVARQEDRFLAEGLMYRHHPQIKRLKDMISTGIIGEVQNIEASFGFKAGSDPESRLNDPDLAGGAIFDVGIYPISLAQMIAGREPKSLCGTGLIGPTGVDIEAHASLTFEGGITATAATSIRRDMPNCAMISGTKGHIYLPDPWTPGRNAGPSDAEIHVTNGAATVVEKLEHKNMLFTFEAQAASAAILQGARELDAVPHRNSIGLAHALERWREGLGEGLAMPSPARLKQLTRPTTKHIPQTQIPGLNQTISKLILGCDNQDHVHNAGMLWDAFWDVGGNTFDTAFVYGGGRHEGVLGQWLKSTGLQNEAQVIAKGAHSPLCLPDVIEVQLDQSLERLGLDRVPIYIMHRDNPDVPVGEFIDALNRLKAKGRIGIFGGSNWSMKRLSEANIYAAQNQLEPLRILNNNLSLAVMEKPVWDGCITSNDPETLATLSSEHLTHLAWSSQARGYFLPEALRNRLPQDTSPETCFGSAANEERRKRADELAREKGVETHHIAAAWVLAQQFTSLALIGPRSAGELVDTLKALEISLTADEVCWLNLAQQQR